MAATNTTVDAIPSATLGSPGLLISLAPMPADSLGTTLRTIADALPGEPVTVATPEMAVAPAGLPPSLRVVQYTPTAPSDGAWVLTAADYLNIFQLAREHHAGISLMLGAECQSLHAQALRNLVQAVSSGADLAVPHYTLHSREALVNSALLYPVTRALFGTTPRFPLPIDLGLSFRAAEVLATAAQRVTTSGQNDAVLWPVAEAASSSLSIVDVEAGERTLPQPPQADLNSLLGEIAGSLFAEIDTRATFWQRSRIAAASTIGSFAAESAEPTPDVRPMLESFRNAYTNLHEIWSLILPPNSLLGLKRLSITPPGSFRMPDALWTRIVYDFTLAWRLRTINRGHLLGALTPLYLAWVASHLLLTSGTEPGHMEPERHIQELAKIFETDKAYLVSRWRWPDRFNP